MNNREKAMLLTFVNSALFEARALLEPHCMAYTRLSRAAQKVNSIIKIYYLPYPWSNANLAIANSLLDGFQTKIDAAECVHDYDAMLHLALAGFETVRAYEPKNQKLNAGIDYILELLTPFELTDDDATTAGDLVDGFLIDIAKVFGCKSNC